MKSFLLRSFDRLTLRATRQILRFLRGYDFDVIVIAKLKAALDSAAYYETHLIHARTMQSDLELLSHAVSLAPSDGLILEFGVASGRTIRHLAEGVGDRTVFGFDSFKGLPENWWSGFEKGHFSQRKPEVPENVHLIEGFFSETLPSFLAMHAESVALLHVDCDLYSSTKTILTLLAERIVSGTVIVFDEYWNYPGWQQHEHRAFQEFLEKGHRSCKYEAFVPSHQQVCAIIQ